MKFLIIPVLITILSACASLAGYQFEPKSVDSAEKLITYESDDFENVAWLTSEPIVNLNHANAVYNYRALFDENDKLQAIQVYVNLRLKNWYFIEDALMKNEHVTLTKIDRMAVGGGTVHEDVAINLNMSLLEKMSVKDTQIKLKGKRGDYIFAVSQTMSQAFLNKLNNHKISNKL